MYKLQSIQVFIRWGFFDYAMNLFQYYAAGNDFGSVPQIGSFSIMTCGFLVRVYAIFSRGIKQRYITADNVAFMGSTSGCNQLEFNSHHVSAGQGNEK